MAEPFKNLLNLKLIKGMAVHFAAQWPAFDSAGFVKAAGRRLNTLELKARSNQITEAMRLYLPEAFPDAAEILLHSLAEDQACAISEMAISEKGIAGWAITPMADYVGLYGQQHFDLSMSLLKEMTKRASSEFGIRYLIEADQQRALNHLNDWAQDSNYHVRRLVSEGSRPRLPWGMQLTRFVKDPVPLLPLLEQLKDDESEYVRRSVANSLNDIAKDHPDLVAKVARRWLKGASVERQKLVRHACRTLIKQGHAPTLRALGYRSPQVKLERLHVLTPEVAFGDALQFEIALSSTTKKDQPLIIDYIIHHQKANGTTAPKVFKWKAITLTARQSSVMQRKHAIRLITTRVYYPGLHGLEIVINGKSMAKAAFELLMA